MRFNYSEDEDFPGQFELWQANCRRSIQSKAGQTALRELEQALVALPEKRLIAEELIDADGEVCAIGALVKYRGIEKTETDPEDMEEVGVELGMPRLVAWKVVCENDVMIDGQYVELHTCQRNPHLGEWRLIPPTPEERYEQMLNWVRRQIKPSEAPNV